MMKKIYVTALLSCGLIACSPAISEEEAINESLQPVNEEKVETIKVEPAKKYKWDCVGCNTQEQMALKAFQDRGITDKLALATLMGNIKHESQFKPDICEGGARVPYEHCHTGGFGLIQWTTVNRYNGLGNFCKKYDCNPSTTEGQLRYLFNEYQWTRSEPVFKTPGKTIEWYTQHGAYPWLGWGIHGARTDYSYNYARMLVEVT